MSAEKKNIFLRLNGVVQVVRQVGRQVPNSKARIAKMCKGEGGGIYKITF